jgi:hypothetical protein
MLKWQSSLLGWKGMICHNHFVGFRVTGVVDCSIDIFFDLDGFRVFFERYNSYTPYVRELNMDTF